MRDRPKDDAETLFEPEVDAVIATEHSRTVHHVVVKLTAEALMPSVRAYMALTALADHGEVLTSKPTDRELESFSGDTIEIWLASDHEKETIEAAATSVPDVASASAAEVQYADRPVGTPAIEEVAAERSPAAAEVVDDQHRARRLRRGSTS